MRSWSDGWRRVVSAPAILAGVWALTFLLALPLAITMRGLLEAHLGSSLAADSAASGVNYDWWQEFTSQATGIGTTFSPTIIGFAATLDNISSLLDGQREMLPVAGASASTSPAGRSSPAASSIATRGSGRRGRMDSLPRRVFTSFGCSGWRWCRESCTGGCSPTSIAGCLSSGSSSARAIIGIEREVFLLAPRALSRVRAGARSRQRDLRLRQDPAGGRGPAQRARCAVGRMRFVWRHRGAWSGSTR